MPEWPEMETYRNLLSPRVCGLLVRSAVVNRPATVNEPVPEFQAGVAGRKILFVERRGKHLLFHLDDGSRLLLHLMLGGWIEHGATASKGDDHYQVILDMEDGNRLFFGGLRLGYLHRMSAKAALERLRELGPDPLDPRLTPAAFRTRLASRRGKLKPVLVDQKFLSGIGNCYSDEIAFRAEVHPETAVSALDEAKIDRLYGAMRTVLPEAAASGGYMDRPLDARDALTGGMNDKLAVYDREGEPCPRCGQSIVKETVASRKMFYCPNCQPVPSR